MADPQQLIPSGVPQFPGGQIPLDVRPTPDRSLAGQYGADTDTALQFAASLGLQVGLPLGIAALTGGIGAPLAIRNWGPALTQSILGPFAPSHPERLQAGIEDPKRIAPKIFVNPESWETPQIEPQVGGGRYTPSENRALAEYRSESDPVNKSLRIEGSNLHPDIQHIDTALAKSDPLPQETIVYRGFSRPTGYKVGDTFTDHGFTSTTLDKELAALLFGRRGDLAVIRVPKGTQAVRMSEISHPDVWAPPDQNEILLPRGSRYTVRKVEFDPTLGPDGKTVLYLDVSPKN